MKKRNVMILVILLVIGFASVSTTLILNGTIGIGLKNDDFDVIFTSANINGEGSIVKIDDIKKKITFSSSKLTMVGEKATLNYKVKNTSTQYDADVTINCTNEASEYIRVTNIFEEEEVTENFKTTFTAQEEKNGVISAELIKSSTDENNSIVITCTIVANATERDNLVEKVPNKICNGDVCFTDNDYSNELSNGDLISLGTESFYVYDIDGDKVKALAQYNLHVGNNVTRFADWNDYDIEVIENPTGIQSSLALGSQHDENYNHINFPWVGTTKYATDDKHGEYMASYNGSVIEEYVNQYKNKFTSFEDEIYDIRLITKEELEELGCRRESIDNCIMAPSFVYATSYFSSSISEENKSRVWVVGSNGGYVAANVSDVRFGVRPVIEIKKSLFE